MSMNTIKTLEQAIAASVAKHTNTKNIKPPMSIAEANTIWRKGLGTLDSDMVTDFLRVTGMIEYTREFDFNSVMNLSKHLDSKPEFVKSIFDSWTAKLCQLGIFKRIEGAYHNPIFILKVNA